MTHDQSYDSDENYWRERARLLFVSNELRGDFIMWLFDTKLDYLDYSETWDEFKKLTDADR